MNTNLGNKTHNWYVIILLGMLLLSASAKLAIADQNTDNLETKIIIQNVTEDEIITKMGTYALSSNARIYNKLGDSVELQYIETPCVARVTYEPLPGKVLPQVSSISVIEVLPDTDLRKNRISRFPE